MKVGDLVKYTRTDDVGLVIAHDDWATLVKWCADGDEDVWYHGDVGCYEDLDLEVISEDR